MQARRPALPLHSAAASSFDQGVDLFYGASIEVAQDGVLQAACGHGELQGVGVGGQDEHVGGKPGALRDEAEDAWRDYKKTGLHVSQSEMESWASSLGTGRPKRPPKWHK